MNNQRKARGGTHSDYAGSCVVCLNGTDTGLAFVGEPEWAAAGLVRMGVPTDQAQATIVNGFGTDGLVPNERITVMFRVCAECADKAGFPVGLLVHGGEIPSVQQPH